MKKVLLRVALLVAGMAAATAADPSLTGTASWYGEAHRGKLMANGQKFDPDKLTAASWAYPLGTKLKVTLDSPTLPRRSVLVTVTDRGPSRELVRSGRIIDLGRAAFQKLAPPSVGLVPVIVQPIR